MPMWGKIDQANNAPKYPINTGSTSNGNTLFGTLVVGIDAGEAVTSTKVAHAGWVRVQYGTGPVTSITIGAAGTGYTNGQVVQVSGGTTNAVATIGTNGSGAVTSLTLTKSGSGFSNTSVLTTAVKATENGSAGTGTTGTFTPVLGGRAGRVLTETLVAMGSMTANGSTLAG